MAIKELRKVFKRFWSFDDLKVRGWLCVYICALFILMTSEGLRSVRALYVCTAEQLPTYKPSWHL